MVDRSMPEPSDEFLASAVHNNYSKSVQSHIKDFTGKLKLAHTLHALDALKRDILRSDLMTNFQAKEELRAIANNRALEVGFKPKKGEAWWG